MTFLFPDWMQASVFVISLTALIGAGSLYTQHQPGRRRTAWADPLVLHGQKEKTTRKEGAVKIGWTVKRVFIATAGGTVLLAGLAMVVLPGPAFIVIPAGLAILAIEFAWAKRWLRKAREWVLKAKARLPKIKRGKNNFV